MKHLICPKCKKEVVDINGNLMLRNKINEEHNLFCDDRLIHKPHNKRGKE